MLNVRSGRDEDGMGSFKVQGSKHLKIGPFKSFKTFNRFASFKTLSHRDSFKGSKLQGQIRMG
jgi:hypothetical protein